MKEFIGTAYEIKDLDEKGIVQFYANTFGVVDTDKDCSLPGSFVKTIGENSGRLRHLKWHDNRFMPGVIKEIKEDQIGLFVTSKLIMNTQLGRETYEEYKAMFEANKQMEHSVKVEAVKYDFKTAGVREVSEWKLWEVSTLNAWGANKESVAISLKNLADATREDIEKELIFLKGLLNITSYSELKLGQIEKQYNYLDKLKAGLQSELSATTDKTTLEEFKRLMRIGV
jgi:HK97 family phage prohead protease